MTKQSRITSSVPQPTPRRDLLTEAADLIDGDRNNQYGDPIQDFRCIATMWTAYLHRKTGVDPHFALAPHDIAAMMALLKISRISWDHHKRDSWTDLAGYAGCGWDCTVRENDA